MNNPINNFPILVIEDDIDDCEFIVQALNATGFTNTIHCFTSPVPALEYLRSTDEVPFIIISDINMPQMNGLAFKKAINADKKLSAQRIPFVFLTTSSQTYMVDEAFHLCVQGYFKKPVALHEYQEIALCIINYWRNSKLPQAVNN